MLQPNGCMPEIPENAGPTSGLCPSFLRPRRTGKVALKGLKKFGRPIRLILRGPAVVAEIEIPLKASDSLIATIGRHSVIARFLPEDLSLINLAV